MIPQKLAQLELEEKPRVAEGSTRRKGMKQMAKSRGVFEKTPKSGEWWVRYAGSDGKIHRERCTWDKIREAGIQVDAATGLERPGKALAQKLYRDRVAQRDRGEKLRAINAHRTVYFRELFADAVTHVRAHNRGAWIDELRIEKMRKKFGDYPAAAIPLQKLQAWFDAQKWSTPATAAIAGRYRLSIGWPRRITACERISVDWWSTANRKITHD
jgi:hypothetical protein